MINSTARRVIESYPGIRLTELSPQLDQVFLGPDLVADFYELSVSIRLCSREEDDSPRMWREVAYNDPAYEDKLRQYLDVRLKYTPEDRLRYLRKEQVKLYFAQKRSLDSL